MGGFTVSEKNSQKFPSLIGGHLIFINTRFFILLPLPSRDREYGTMHVVSNLVPRIKCSVDFTSFGTRF